jgi:hypothetical protein
LTSQALVDVVHLVDEILLVEEEEEDEDGSVAELFELLVLQTGNTFER